jgi:Mg2+/Co2+ transporter CorB
LGSFKFFLRVPKDLFQTFKEKNQSVFKVIFFSKIRLSRFMNPLLVFLGILIFSIVGSFLSASETAVVACSRIRLHQLAKKGSKRASQLLKLQERMGQLIGSILVANMFVLTFISSLATEFATQLFGLMGVVYATTLMSLFITIYVEVVPKMYVYQSPERIGLKIVPFLMILRSCLYPITAMVEKIASITLKLFGVSQVNGRYQDHDSGRDELMGAIELYKNGYTGLHERAMLQGILDLSCVTVSEIMVHRKNIFSVDALLPKKVICNKVSTSPFTRVPLWDKNSDNIKGVINGRKLARALYAVDGNWEDLDWDQLISEPWFVPAGTVLLEQLQAFRRQRRHQAFVVDEYGSLLGMVTLEDILEEIVGEILDEHNVDIPGIRISKEGNYLIRGDVTIRDLNRQYQWDLPMKNASTLGGLILENTHAMPKAGQEFFLYGLKIIIARCHANRINLLSVLPYPKKNEVPEK